MNTLFLTANEKALFDQLPDSLKEGWKVESETLTVQDTAERRKIRLQLMQLQDSALVEVQKKAQKAGSHEELMKIIETVDLTSINDNDLGEILFVLGPDGISDLVSIMLYNAKTDTDIEAIVGFTNIRRSLNESMHVTL